MFDRVLGLMELWTHGLMEPKLEKLISTFVILKHLINLAVNANISFLGYKNTKKLKKKKIYFFNHIHTPLCLEGGVQEIFYRQVSK